MIETHPAAQPSRRPKPFLRGTRLLVLTGVMLLGASSSSAHESIAQMYQRSWTVKDGAPANIEMMIQGPDGFIWITTGHGLYRFDGVAFERYQTPPGTALLSNQLNQINFGTDGSMWLTYMRGGVSRIKGEAVTHYTEKDGLYPGHTGGTAEDREGRMWVSGARGLQFIRDGRVTSFHGANGEGDSFAETLEVDGTGNLWVPSGAGLIVLKRGATEFIFASKTPFGGCSVAHNGDGVLCHRGAEPLTQFRVVGGEVVTRPLLPGGTRLWSSLASRDGTIWVGTRGSGILRFTPSSGSEPAPRQQDVEFFANKDGLSDESAFHLIEDFEGSVWVATPRGLEQFRRVPFLKITNLDTVSLPLNITRDRFLVSAKGIVDVTSGAFSRVTSELQEVVFCLYQADDGAVWLGTLTRLLRYADGRLTEVPLPAGTSGRVFTIVEDASHALWVSIANTGLFRLDQQGWSKRGGYSELPDANPYAALRDRRGDLWFSFADKLARISSGVVTWFDSSAGLNVAAIRTLHAQDDRLWVGGDNGVGTLSDGRFQPLRLKGVDNLRAVSGIVFANDGDLWLSSGSGVYRVEANQLSRREPDGALSVDWHHFDDFDGLEGIPRGPIIPSAGIDSSGKLYFSTGGGLYQVDPARLVPNSRPPQVWITSFRTHADDTSPALGALQLEPNTRDLEIAYAATSLLIPERVRFRYRLQGFDEDWVEAGTRRKAIYSKLPPGRYTFQVVAANDSGVWNTVGAMTTVVVAPAFYETLWFKALLAIPAGGLLWSLYWFRLRQATAAVQKRLLAQMDERERIARELHDTLLQGFQGITLRVQGVAKNLPTQDPLRTMLDEVMDRADDVLREARYRVRDLRRRAADEEELPERLTKCGQDLARDHAAAFSLAIVGEPKALEPTVQNEACTIAREAMTNAFRHASASRIETEITYDPAALRIRVRDDGSGIDKATLTNGQPGHWGLTGMRERARGIRAELNIWSRESAGTEVELVVPAAIAYPQRETRAS